MSETLELTITNNGYVRIATTFVSNVVNNIKTTKDWGKDDAIQLLLSSLSIARNLPQEDFEVLISDLSKMYNVSW